MGYDIKVVSGSLLIPNEVLPVVLERWKLLNEVRFDSLKRGGTYYQNKKVAAWYSFMPKDYHLEVKSVQDVLSLLRFDYETTNAGVLVTGFEGKCGQEDLFFSAISRWVVGSLRWMGEDGTSWLWDFPVENYSPSYYTFTRQALQLSHAENFLPLV